MFLQILVRYSHSTTFKIVKNKNYYVQRTYGIDVKMWKMWKMNNHSEKPDTSKITVSM